MSEVLNITFINRMMGIKFGGGENFDLNLARALKKCGHNVRFVIGREWKKLSLPMDEFEVVYIKTPYLRDIHYKIKPTNFFKKIISVLVLEIDLFLFENAVFKYLKNDNWTQVYQICGLPRLGNLLGGQDCSTKQQQSKIAVVRWPGIPSKRKVKYMQKCSANFANGDAYIQIKNKLYNEIRNINLGINLEKYVPKKDKNIGNIINFLFVGRIIPIKNLSFMIKAFLKAFEKNQNIILNIVGNGEKNELEILQNLARNCKNINFFGAKFGDELLKQYQNNDVFLITSKYDNYPNVVFEAMACGLPVIGTRVGGIPLQICDEIDGYLVDLNDIDMLAEKILTLANDKQKMQNMSKNARVKMQKEFSWDKSAKQVESLYKGLLAI